MDIESSSYTNTSLSSLDAHHSHHNKLRCCRCFEVRVGMFVLGLWSIIATVGYYIGFSLLWYRDSGIPYPIPVLYLMAAIGFIGGSVGIITSIFESLRFCKGFFVWAVVHFFCQFAEGILYAKGRSVSLKVHMHVIGILNTAGYSCYILFFIDFILWGYFIIVINQYIQLLTSKKRHPHGLMINTQHYQSTFHN
eukprot:838118_1